MSNTLFDRKCDNLKEDAIVRNLIITLGQLFCCVLTLVVAGVSIFGEKLLINASFAAIVAFSVTELVVALGVIFDKSRHIKDCYYFVYMKYLMFGFAVILLFIALMGFFDLGGITLGYAAFGVMCSFPLMQLIYIINMFIIHEEYGKEKINSRSIKEGTLENKDIHKNHTTNCITV